ncbi:MAG TPA: polyphenol oxidase family protein [Acidimicrobiia bacterium]|nr:polyphenol oxidase family protein [Acidimicrobiia bacterium]
MISPRPGVAFSLADAGDLRSDPEARLAFALQLGIPSDWATVDQVHGGRVVEATGPANWGEADAIFTRIPQLPVAVFTADCVGVALWSEGAVGVAHAGWRGAVASVVSELFRVMTESGHPPLGAGLSPRIGPCCYEVGEEVAARFPFHNAVTTWGTRSVDLSGAVASQLPDLEVFTSELCTFHDEGLFSHRRDGTSRRMATVAWLL